MRLGVATIVSTGLWKNSCEARELAFPIRAGPEAGLDSEVSSTDFLRRPRRGRPVESVPSVAFRHFSLTPYP